MSPSLRSQAIKFVWNKYSSDRMFNPDTGEEESVDDWGYGAAERNAFLAGVDWLAEQQQVDLDAD